MDDHLFLHAAVALAVANVHSGGGPFGAVVARGSQLLAEGVNQVTSTLDPTAHAEIVAIRAACRVCDDFALPGTTLFASCEPCPMCLASAMWARVDRVVYAATRHDAAAAGFDDRRFYAEFEGSRSYNVTRLPADDTLLPFERWRAKTDRVDY